MCLLKTNSSRRCFRGCWFFSQPVLVICQLFPKIYPKSKQWPSNDLDACRYHVGTQPLVSVGNIQTEKSAIKGAPFALSLPGPTGGASWASESSIGFILQKRGEQLSWYRWRWLSMYNKYYYSPVGCNLCDCTVLHTVPNRITFKKKKPVTLSTPSTLT